MLDNPIGLSLGRLWVVSWCHTNWAWPQGRTSCMFWFMFPYVAHGSQVLKIIPKNKYEYNSPCSFMHCYILDVLMNWKRILLCRAATTHLITTHDGTYVMLHWLILYLNIEYQTFESFWKIYHTKPWLSQHIVKIKC